jgi:hypothetical protein
VPSLQRIRQRVPWIVALLMVLMAFTAVGLACACMSDHPMQGIERTVAASASALSIAVPVVYELWAMTVLAALTSVAFVATQRTGFGRASPAVLQRFRF